MELFESKRCRRLLLQLDAGLELIDWLHRFTSLPTPRWAEVRVYGTAKAVELRSLLARSTGQRLTGAIELIELRGLVGGDKAPPLRGQLVVDGKQLLSGEILRLDCLATLVTLDLYEDMAPFTDAVPDMSTAPTGKTWDEAVAASGPPIIDPPEEPPIKIGDILEHAKFGRCIVERVEGEQHVTVRTATARMLRLSLEVLDLHVAGHEGKTRVWRGEIAKP